MLKRVITGICSLSFVTTGFGVLLDPNCNSVDFSGGRAVLVSCRADNFGTIPGSLAGLSLILGGFLLVYFFIPEVDKLLKGRSQSDQIKSKPKLINQPVSKVVAPTTQNSDFEIKVCLDCKERIPLNYEKCFKCQGMNLQVRLANLNNLSEMVLGDEMPETKTCPECAEEVKFAAKKCKHCGSQI